MTPVVITALLVAFIVYIWIGIYLGRRTHDVADLLPLEFSKQARVRNSAEFSASTVATTISLATVVMAFFELASKLGLWLFWTVITTAAGLLVVRLMARQIWQRISLYDHRPTLLEFLSTEFGSESLGYVGAICVSLGFLFAFAVELTVGSKFFAALVPGIPTWTVVIVLSVVSFVYTAIGGFRAVIVTDRLQMISIWLLLLALPAFYVYYVLTHGGWSANIAKVPESVLNFSYRPGLTAFLLGIFVINVPTFISDMSIWQRIAGAQEPKTVATGLWRSVFSAATTWGCIALLACFAFMLIDSGDDRNPLISVIDTIAHTSSSLSTPVLFFVTLGLYGAMLSTASTQLIAVSHTLYEDVISRARKHPLKQRIDSKRELDISRSILILAAMLSTVFVQILSYAGFSIADLVFAIYGAQLGLCPLVIAALILSRDRLKEVSVWAVTAISGGFIIGWGSAVVGRLSDSDNLVFMAPVLSLIASTFFLFIGFLAAPKTGADSNK